MGHAGLSAVIWASIARMAYVAASEGHASSTVARGGMVRGIRAPGGRAARNPRSFAISWPLYESSARDARYFGGAGMAEEW